MDEDVKQALDSENRLRYNESVHQSMGGIRMEKKNLGAVLALYPTPVTVVGAMVQESRIGCSLLMWVLWGMIIL